MGTSAKPATEPVLRIVFPDIAVHGKQEACHGDTNMGARDLIRHLNHLAPDKKRRRTRECGAWSPL